MPQLRALVADDVAAGHLGRPGSAALEPRPRQLDERAAFVGVQHVAERGADGIVGAHVDDDLAIAGGDARARREARGLPGRSPRRRPIRSLSTGGAAPRRRASAYAATMASAALASMPCWRIVSTSAAGCWPRSRFCASQWPSCGAKRITRAMRSHRAGHGGPALLAAREALVHLQAAVGALDDLGDHRQHALRVGVLHPRRAGFRPDRL